MKIFVFLITISISLVSSSASPKKSLLNNDPDVIYLEEHIGRSITLLVVQPTTVYATKKGKNGRRLGLFKTNTKVELIAMTEKAYCVKGKASHAGVTGWVNPNHLASKDKDFISNLKQLYKRQLIVKDLIANKDVAIGMTLDEVQTSLGEPTETEIVQTRDGQSGKWDYVITEEQKHYRKTVDPHTGQVYRQLSHVTVEERSRTTVKFKDKVVTSLTRKKNNGPGKIRIVPAPVIFHW